MTHGSGRLPLTLVNSDGSTDVIRVKVDMSKEVVPDLNDFTLNPDEAASIGFSRSGTTEHPCSNNQPARRVPLRVL
jgi:hypothetical protein